MLTNQLTRNTNKVRSLITLADQLSLSLREGVEFLSINDNNRASFLTESKHIISGDFNIATSELSNISVISAEPLSNVDIFDKLITNKTKDLLLNLLLDPTKGSKAFDNILEAFESRLTYDRSMKRLEEKTNKLEGLVSVMGSDTFTNLEEIRSQLIKFLQENKKDLLGVSEIKNSLILGGIISQALDLPKVELNKLQETKSYKISDKRFNAVYDMICKQELIKKELYENKKSLDDLWINSDKINKLLENVGKVNKDKLAKALADVIEENPYFALASKKQLSTIFNRSLKLNESSLPIESVKILVSNIFEMKKPVKSALLKHLHENYGITEQTLSTNPSFNDLCKTQKVLFETLYKLAPRKSVLKSVLKEMSEITDCPYGVESIDLNNWIFKVFIDSGYTDVINETSLLNYMDFAKVAKDLSQIGSVLQMIQGTIAGGGQPGQQMPGGQSAMGGLGDRMAAQFGAGGGSPQPAVGDTMEDPDGSSELESLGQGEGGGDANLAGQMDPNAAAEEAQMGAEMGDGEAPEMEEEPNSMMDQPAENVPQDELMQQISMLDSLLSDLKADLGMEDAPDMSELEGEEEFPEGGMEGEEGMPEGEEGGEEEGDVNLDTGDGDDDVHLDVKSHDGADEEEPSEESSDGEDEDDDGDMDEKNPKAKKTLKKAKSKGD